MINYSKFKNKKILITGHSGFKGSWLSFIFYLFGSKVYGISDKYEKKSLFSNLNLINKTKTYLVNINDHKSLSKIINSVKPDIIFHLAAESIVSRSYKKPIETFKTNIIGTANVLDSLRYLNHKCTAIIITSDKCYENKELTRSYKENDQIGGSDPYSASKGAAEIIISSMNRSFLKNNKNIKIGICRAGNVIGGGDWSPNRLIPDLVRSIKSKKTLLIRNPNSTRPWQHVLDPLNGYIILAYNLYFKKLESGLAFNFGPSSLKNHRVKDILEIVLKICKFNYKTIKDIKIKEASLLSLNSNKAKKILNWKCKINTKKSIIQTIDWYLYYFQNPKQIEKFTKKQIENFFYNL